MGPELWGWAAADWFYLCVCVCACVFVYMRHTLKNKQASTKAQQDADKFKHIPTEHV